MYCPYIFVVTHPIPKKVEGILPSTIWLAAFLKGEAVEVQYLEVFVTTDLERV